MKVIVLLPPDPSSTVIDTGYEPPADGAPDINPPLSSVTPGGRPVAENVSVSPSGSPAFNCNEAELP